VLIIATLYFKVVWAGTVLNNLYPGTHPARTTIAGEEMVAGRI
jgi:hypothetical protein